jgi:hypothetical protein
MDGHRNTVAVLQYAGRTDMIDVSMGVHEQGDIAGCETSTGDGTLNDICIARKSSIDQDGLLINNQIGIGIA